MTRGAPDPTPRAGDPARWHEWLAELVGRRGRPSPTTERLLLGVALLAFATLGLVSWRNLPELDRATRLVLLAPAAAVAAAGLAINGGEVVIAAWARQRHVPVSAAMGASALSSAVNLLPVPGAALVKVRTLRQHGLDLRTSATLTAGIGVTWVAIGVGMAGLLAASLNPASLAAMAGGIVLLSTGVLLLRSGLTEDGPDLGPGPSLPLVCAAVIALELLSVTATTLRLWLVAAALGFDVAVSDAAALAAAGIAASASGLLPGGLGLRELLSGLAARIVGIPASVGVVVAAVDRLVTLATLAAITGMLVAVGFTATRSGPDTAPAGPGGPGGSAEGAVEDPR